MKKELTDQEYIIEMGKLFQDKVNLLNYHASRVMKNFAEEALKLQSKFIRWKNKQDTESD